MTNIINIANDILCMQEELEYLREKVKSLESIEDKYNKSLDSSTKHAQIMKEQVMELIVNKGHFKERTA